MFPSPAELISNWAKAHPEFNVGNNIMCTPDSAIGSVLNFNALHCGEQLHRVLSEVRPSCTIMARTRSSESADESRQEEEEEGSSKHSRYISI